MTRIKTGKWGHSKLSLKADMTQASSPIWYQIENWGWDVTPFQVATARHSWPAAFKLVKGWLGKTNPSHHSRVRRVSKTGWLKAKAVRIVRQKGRTVVQIKRSASRRKR